MTIFTNYFSALIDYFIISGPYLLLGLAVSALIKAFLSDQWIKKQLGQTGFLAPIKATLIGIPLPLCSCSVIPTAITFKKAGASKASTSAFLIATPESGVDSISMTYAMMDLPMTIIRPIAALASGLTAAFLQIFSPEDNTVTEEIEEHHHCCNENKSKSENFSFKAKLIKGLKYSFGDLVDDIAVWLLFGLLFGAAIESFIPADFFENISATHSRLAILLIGIPLYICASATTPIAAALMAKGMSPGTALLLLLVGPATNVSNFVVLQKYLGKKSMILNLIAIGVVSLAFSYLTDYLYKMYEWKLTFNIEALHEHGEHSHWFAKSCALIMALLISKGIYNHYFKKSKN